jgi:flagellar biosynthesis/type III secretory pathway chaperone
MAESVAELITALGDSRSALEEFHQLLQEEQRCIVDLDLSGLSTNGESKEKILVQLQTLNGICQEQLRRTGMELGLAADCSLTPLITRAASPVRDTLLKLQNNILDVAGSVNRLNSVNRELLQNSISMTGRSMEFFLKLLQSSDTYGASGQMAEGTAQVRILCREI